MPENDIWIAAIALQNDLILVTSDIHFVMKMNLTREHQLHYGTIKSGFPFLFSFWALFVWRFKSCHKLNGLDSLSLLKFVSQSGFTVAGQFLIYPQQPLVRWVKK